MRIADPRRGMRKFREDLLKQRALKEEILNPIPVDKPTPVQQPQPEQQTVSQPTPPPVQPVQAPLHPSPVQPVYVATPSHNVTYNNTVYPQQPQVQQAIQPQVAISKFGMAGICKIVLFALIVGLAIAVGYQLFTNPDVLIDKLTSLFETIKSMF